MIEVAADAERVRIAREATATGRAARPMASEVQRVVTGSGGTGCGGPCGEDGTVVAIQR